jgi:3-methylfumaryl-CoA hydratase
MTLSPDAIARWRGHIGRSELRRQRLDSEALRRFAAAVGADLDVERSPPPLAHWAFFLETPTGTDLGQDGHPRRGPGLLPPITLPRRMFASSTMRFGAPLSLDEEAQLTLTVADVLPRSGKTGDLVFVQVDRALTQNDQLCVSEQQTLVYRDAGPQMASVELAATPGGAHDEVWTPTSTDLFRFSAVTFNAHRIHYDRAYTQEIEGYPDLVVQGPFTAVKLAALAQRRQPGRRLASFEFRASAPLFVDQPVRLIDVDSEVQAIRCDAIPAMSARATFQDVQS